MKKKKIPAFFFVLLIVMAVFLLNMAFIGKISDRVLMVLRIGLTLLFFAAWSFSKWKKQAHFKNLAFTLGVINLAFFIVSFFTAELWNLNLESARGIALIKLSDSFFISLVLIISFLLGGYKLREIYLHKGRFSLGIIIGLISFILMGYFALNTVEQPVESNFLKRNILWILLFVFSNAFMEELLFRGIFLKQLNDLFTPFWAIFLTAFVFGAAHLQVTYTSDAVIFSGIVFLLGLIWGFLMHYTKSIIASLFFHAGADLLIILPIYSSFGVIA